MFCFFTRQCCRHTWSLDSWAMRIASCRARSACWLQAQKTENSSVSHVLFKRSSSRKHSIYLVLTSGQSDSASLPDWGQRSGDFGRSPRPRCSSPRFQTRWGGRSNVRDCEQRGTCPGLSCCSDSSGNAEERENTIKGDDPLSNCW